MCGWLGSSGQAIPSCCGVRGRGRADPRAAGRENRILRGGFRTGHPHPSGGQAQNQRLVWMLEVRSWGWRLAVGEHGHGGLGWPAAVVAGV